MNKYEMALDLITQCEGISLKSYQDSAGIWTIAVGLARHYLDGSAICEGDTCTEEQAMLWLQQYCEINVYPRIDSWIPNFNVTDRMYASLSAFVYNVGVLGISLISALRHDDMNELKEAFLKYDKVRNSDGELEFCEGLHNRRLKEINFFMNEDGSLK